MDKKQYPFVRLKELGFSSTDIAYLASHGWNPEDVLDQVNQLLNMRLTTESFARDTFFEQNEELIAPPSDKEYLGRKGSEYKGNLQLEYLWKPYIQYNEFQDIFGKSGSGKTFFVSLVCASTTTGVFPTETRPPGNVLYVSGEESFDEIADRILRCGGDLNRLTIIDRSVSIGLDFDGQYEMFCSIVQKYNPDLLVCDPWQCFCGERIDLNRQNMTRPLLQKISLLARATHCAIIFVAHMNKSNYFSDANDGLSGSSEIVNAARSAFRIIEDETDENRRIAIHTKANHAKRGDSLRFRFTEDHRIVWDGFSDITKETLEQASRNRKTPFEVVQSASFSEKNHMELISALLKECGDDDNCGIRITYDELREKHGESIFGGRQPKRALDDVTSEMQKRGILLKTGIDIRRGAKHHNGIFLQRIEDEEKECPYLF